MNPEDNIDTIVAVATPSGPGGVGVIRVSGPEVTEIAKKILGTLPPPFKRVIAHLKIKTSKYWMTASQSIFLSEFFYW